MKKFFADFKKFITKGNVLDLAVGVIIGTAFNAIVNSLVNDMIMPLISRVIGINISTASVVLKDAVLNESGEVLKNAIVLKYGNFIQCILNFFIIGLSLFTAIKSISYLSKTIARQQVKYLKRLKKKHPELFDEDSDVGTITYKSLKEKYPQFFEDEAIAEEKAVPTNDEKMVELLSEIKTLLKDKE